MKRHTLGLLLWVLFLLPTPERQPPVVCICGTSNEPSNKHCISCKALL